MNNKDLRALLNEFDDNLPVYLDTPTAIELTREHIQVDELFRHRDKGGNIPALFISFPGTNT